MMKLTNAIRDETKQTILRKKFEPRIHKIKKKLQTIAQETANAFYPKKIRDWIDAAPPGGLHSKTAIYLADGEDYFCHELIGPTRRYANSKSYIDLRKPIKVLANDQYTEEMQVSAKNAARLELMKIELNQIDEQRKETDEILASALWGCNTYKQVEDHYPDLFQHLPKPKPQTKALAVTNDVVKKILP